MSQAANHDLWAVFDARRVKAPELKNIDHAYHAIVGWCKNRRPMVRRLRAMVDAVELLEPEIQKLGAVHFREEVDKVRTEARLGRLEGRMLERAMALTREAAKRSVGMRPYAVQVMGALAMYYGNVAEMATGEGKTLTASLCASLWAWQGKPVHIITVNDYLVHRDATEMSPVYKMLGHRCGHVVHETPAQERNGQYRSNVVYITSKELVADFLRDQIAMNNLRSVGKQVDSAFTKKVSIDRWHSTILDARSATQAGVGMLAAGQQLVQPLIPGLWRVLVDEADSLLIDEAVTPLIISNSPTDEPNKDLYVSAHELAGRLVLGRDFKLDSAVRTAELTLQGQVTLDDIAEGSGFWRGKRRREELVTQALTARYLFLKDEHYLIGDEEKIQIIDEFTGRVMADRSWRHGLHQAIEVKEAVPVTADKENLAHLSFQRFFRQFPIMGGMTGTAWEANGELWQIYQRPVVRIPTNKPCIRLQEPIRMFDTSAEKYDAAIARICELNDKGVPVLVGTRSVLASDEVSKRLTASGKSHRVLNAAQNKEEAAIVSMAGQRGVITVATNMAGRGTDIKLSRDVAALGGLHVISTEPHGSYRVDRQLFGRAARQGDPGSAQLFASAEDDIFVRHTPRLRKMWRTVGVQKLLKMAQDRAEKLARFNRKQVLKNDDWMDQAMPF